MPINIHKNYIKYVFTRYFLIHEVRPRPVLSSPPQALEHTGRHTLLSMHFQPHVSLPPKTIWVTYVTRVTIVTSCCQEKIWYSERMRNELEIYQDIAEVLEQRRVDLKMSKRQLSKLANITPAYLREVLRGERKPSVAILISLCAALDLKISELFIQLELQNKI